MRLVFCCCCCCRWWWWVVVVGFFLCVCFVVVAFFIPQVEQFHGKTKNKNKLRDRLVAAKLEFADTHTPNCLPFWSSVKIVKYFSCNVAASARLLLLISACRWLQTCFFLSFFFSFCKAGTTFFADGTVSNHVSDLR